MELCRLRGPDLRPWPEGATAAAHDPARSDPSVEGLIAQSHRAGTEAASVDRPAQV